MWAQSWWRNVKILCQYLSLISSSLKVCTNINMWLRLGPLLCDFSFVQTHMFAQSYASRRFLVRNIFQFTSFSPGENQTVRLLSCFSYNMSYGISVNSNSTEFGSFFYKEKLSFYRKQIRFLQNLEALFTAVCTLLYMEQQINFRIMLFLVSNALLSFVE